MRQLDDWIKGYMEYTDNTESSDQFRKWSAISVVASALQRKCYLKWGLQTFYPNMYIVLVGPTGARKGTAMKPGLEIARLVDDIEIASNSATRQALIRNLVRTTEAYENKEGELVQHSSLTIFSEELTVFLGYNNKELMANLTDWYDCGNGPEGSWTYETVSRKKEEVKGIWVNLLGATTPELIQSTLPQDAIGGGLTSRMIFVYASGKKKPVPIPFLSERQEELESILVDDLEEVSNLKGEFKITEECLEQYYQWYVYQEENQPFTDPRLAGYVQRRASHVLKLSMIMSASSRNDLMIKSNDFQRALDNIREMEDGMINVFGGIGDSEISDILNKVMKTIAMSKEIKRSTLLRKYHHDADKQIMDKVLSTLSAMGWCEVKYDGSGSDCTIEYTDEDNKEE